MGDDVGSVVVGLVLNDGVSEGDELIIGDSEGIRVGKRDGD